MQGGSWRGYKPARTPRKKPTDHKKDDAKDPQRVPVIRQIAHRLSNYSTHNFLLYFASFTIVLRVSAKCWVNVSFKTNIFHKKVTEIDSRALLSSIAGFSPTKDIGRIKVLAQETAISRFGIASPRTMLCE